MSFNKIIIVGHLGKDVELRYTPQGKAVADVSVATTEKTKDRNGSPTEITTWFKCTLWGAMAENAAKYLSKGSLAYFEGRLRQDEWQDRDGKTRITLAVQATDMRFIGDGSGGRGRSANANADSTAPGDYNDDLGW